MCGICGFYKINSSKRITERYIKTMCTAMSHRGPDAEGVWIDSSNVFGLGHRRLSILDLSENASQPMISNSGNVVIAFNGEIYNYEEIRGEIKDKYEWFTDHSDTEVILHAYEEWGIECINKFRGMFSLAIADRNKKCLWLIRDRIGIKPLYYFFEDGILTFASEIKALLQVKSKLPEIDCESFIDYFSFATSGRGKTMFEGVFKVEPATVLCIRENENISKFEYWDVLDHINPDVSIMTEEDIADLLLDELKRSVEMRTCSDVPIGTFLSGGIDSSFVTLLMPNNGEKKQSFCVGYEQEVKSYASEFSYSEQIARLANTHHIKQKISEEMAWDAFHTIFYYQDEPLGEHAEIPTYFVSKLAKENGVTVIETGDGADELFFGYPALKKFLQIGKLKHVAGGEMLMAAMQLVLNMTKRKEGYVNEIISRVRNGDPLYWEDTSLTLFEKNRIISSNVRDKIGAYNPISEVMKTYSNYIEKRGNKVDYNWISYFSLCHRLPELLLTRVDKMSMSNSLECRVPFLDHKFVELVMSIPGEIKTKNYITKYILKRAAQGTIPNELLQRKKQGFGSPVLDWMNGKYRNDIFGIIQDFNDNTSLLNQNYIDEKRNEAFTWNDWYLFNMAYWWRIYYK